MFDDQIEIDWDSLSYYLLQANHSINHPHISWNIMLLIKSRLSWMDFTLVPDSNSVVSPALSDWM